MNKSTLCNSISLALLGLAPMAVVLADTAPVVVTASRMAETVDQTLASVTVIGREQIEASQATDLSELLAGLPGVNLSANGGDGKSKSLFLRGTASSHTLLLIDGVRVGSATLGSPAWALIPLHDIERIELVRGPRSSLYGSDAIGGVIQVFTRNGGEGFRGELSAGYGSDNHRKLGAAISDGDGQTRYRLALSGEKSNGYDSHQDSEFDKDGYDNLSFSGSVSHRFSDRLRLSGQLMRAEGTNEFDASFGGNSSNFVQQSTSVSLDASISDNWSSTLRLSQSRDESDNLTNGVFTSAIDTLRNQLTWENQLTLDDANELVAGIDYLNDQVGGTNTYSVRERDNKAVFAQYRFFGERNDLQLGARLDDNEQFGSHLTGNIGWGYALTDNLRLTASAGTAFKAPTFNDLYWPASAFSAGNPNLQPEKARSYELGISGKQMQIDWSARVYKSTIKNLIEWACTANCADADPFNDFWQPSNVSNARIKGLELQAGTTLMGWQTQASINLVDPENAATGRTLAKRAKQNLRIDLDRDFGRWAVGGTLLAESGRWNNDTNTVWLGGYATVDLRASYQLAPQWTLRGTIDNLFERSYETADGYPMPGRELFLSIHYATR